MLKALVLICGDKNLPQSVHEGAIVFLIAVENIVPLLSECVKNSEKMPVCGINFVPSVYFTQLGLGCATASTNRLPTAAHTSGLKHLQEHKLHCEEESETPNLKDPAVFLSLHYLYRE